MGFAAAGAAVEAGVQVIFGGSKEEDKKPSGANVVGGKKPAGGAVGAAEAVEVDLSDHPTPIPRHELVAMTKKPPHYRKPIPEKTERDAARKRAKEAGKKRKCHLDGLTMEVLEKDSTSSTKWRTKTVPVRRVTQAGPEQLGQATDSMGIELYFFFLRRSFVVFSVWSLLMIFIIVACLEPSKSDESLSVGFLALFSLASFGNAPHEHDQETWKEREVVGWRMVELTPVLAWLSAIGAVCYIAFSLWFRYRHIPFRVHAHLVEHVSPSHFTLEVEKLPKLGDEKYGNLLGDDYAEQLRPRNFIPSPFCLCPASRGREDVNINLWVGCENCSEWGVSYGYVGGLALVRVRNVVGKICKRVRGDVGSGVVWGWRQYASDAGKGNMGRG